MKNELILALRKEQVLEFFNTYEQDESDIYIANGKDVLDSLIGHLDGTAYAYIPRELAEHSEEYVHPIPYIIVMNEKDEILTYQRGKGVGESRLLGNHSIGWGGHMDMVHILRSINIDIETKQISLPSISPEGSVNLDSAILDSMRVELDEELGIDIHEKEVKGSVMGVFYDTTDDVGKVHLGVCVAIKLDKELSPLEDSLLDCGYKSINQLKIEHVNGKLDLENWSKIIIDNFLV